MIFQYIILGFVFSAGIGPANFEMIKRALTGKAWPAMVFYIGTGIIDMFYISVVMFGFSFFSENMMLKIALGVFGIGYLLYLGITDIRDYFKKEAFAQGIKLPTKKKMHPFVEGMLVNLANPVAIASWTAFYGVVAADFGKSTFNIIPVMIGAYSVGLVILFVAYFCKKVAGEKIMRVVSLLSGIILIGFSLMFAWGLLRS